MVESDVPSLLVIAQMPAITKLTQILITYSASLAEVHLV